MSLWTEITNTALIGSERKPLSLNGGADTLGGLLAQLDQNDREGSLLGAAALVSLYTRAGSLPPKDPRPAPEACEIEDAPHCGEQAAIHLAMMLQGEHKELLPEWIAKMAAAGRRAPDELLPLLLNTGRTLDGASQELPRVLGARGRWLAAQNPDWAYVVGEVDETQWETGSRQQRQAILAELRTRDAAGARELLASNWAKESPEDRAGFLEAFKNGLSLDDEAFLEEALGDRRKEVRSVAADLLARLPESALRRRMFERARSLITFRLNRVKRKTIDVTLPEVCDKAMQRDGVEQARYYQAQGEKSWWLQQILGSIPPKIWPQETGWTIGELIEAAKRTDWETTLIGGWARAALLCGDLEWADILVEGVHRDHALPLFQILPHSRQDAIIIKSLKSDSMLDTDKTAYAWITNCQRPWSEALSRAVIDSLQKTAENTASRYAWTWTLFSDVIGRHLDPALIPETVTRLTKAAKSPEIMSAMDQFLNFIQFRHEMLKEC